MDIKDKLAYLKSHRDQDAKTSLNPETGRGWSSLHVLAEHFKGVIHEPNAPYLKIERFYERSFADKISLSFLSKNDIEHTFSLKDCLFFDLETTGLMGGAGTFAFLLGFGYIHEQRFVVRQYFIPDFGREYAVYKELYDFLKQFPLLVSFNGKSYDLPLLRNRFIINRISIDFDKQRHIDLLHLTRRIWKDSLASCDLNTVETNILGRSRSDDIDGYYIPAAYFNFIRTGVIHDIKRTIDHNYIDITSLADLLHVLNNIENDPSPVTDDRALLRLARLAFEQDQQLYLERFLQNASPSVQSVHQINVWKSLLLKKQKKWNRAASIWQQLINVPRFTFFALEELAKYHEHIEKDIQSAINCTERALQHLETLINLQPQSTLIETRKAFFHRRKRLARKSI